MLRGKVHDIALELFHPCFKMFYISCFNIVYVINNKKYINLHIHPSWLQPGIHGHYHDSLSRHRHTISDNVVMRSHH